VLYRVENVHYCFTTLKRAQINITIDTTMNETHNLTKALWFAENDAPMDIQGQQHHFAVTLPTAQENLRQHLQSVYSADELETLIEAIQSL
jgi:hypothetical protein